MYSAPSHKTEIMTAVTASFVMAGVGDTRGAAGSLNVVVDRHNPRSLAERCLR